MKPVLWRFLLLLCLAVAGAARAEPLLFYDNRAELTRLEEAGFGFEDIFGAPGAGNLAALTSAAPSYDAIADTVAADLAGLRAEFEAGGRPLEEFTARETGRILDMRWLSSEAARFRLIGIVNRLDRRDFHALRGEAGCGEIRLVYRLAYAFRKGGRGKVLSSRMPFDFNAVYDVPADADGGCAAAVARWTPPDDRPPDAAWFLQGPLSPAKHRFRQLELNAQIVRFHSGQEPEFGGQAVYLMRIFALDGTAADPLPLENTPDTDRIASDAALRADLVAFLRGHAGAIDEGVYRIPDRFLARRVISFSTFGAARPVNNPFTAVLSPEDFVGLDLGAGRLVRSPEALIARLDNGTCQGCHQAGSTAGFHFIGLDDGETSPLNRILVGVSPHFHAEQPRRAAYAAAVAAGEEPDRFRPLSIAPPARWQPGGPSYDAAGAAMPCLVDPDDEGFAGGWSCEAGTQCVALASTAGTHLRLAQCLVTDAAEMFSGHPCLAGALSPGGALPFDDAYALTQFAAFAPKASARDYTCRPPRIGVPGGMAYRQCDEKDRAFSKFRDGGAMPREICGLTGGKKFDLCVATGNFDRCLAGAIQRGNRAACSAEQFCRDDYICQAFPADTPNAARVPDTGFCSPTYFMFQMRIDNHTTPWPRDTDRAFGEAAEEPLYRSVEAGPGEDPDDLW